MKIVFTTIIAAFAAFFIPSEGHSQARQPRLIVEIIIGQMRYDYIRKVEVNLNGKGFSTLSGGISCLNARYSYNNTTSPAGIATITSGANPSTHGILSGRWIDFTTNASVDAVADDKYFGVGVLEADGRYAPTKLNAGTLGDRIKSHSAASKVLSVALTPLSSVVAGGSMPDAAYWFDASRGRWVTSTYYMNRLPVWIENYNDKGYAATYRERVWDTYLPIDKYLYGERGSYSSSHPRLGRTKNGAGFAGVVSTPIGTEMLMDFVRSAIIYENLGKDNNADLLVVTIDPTRIVSQAYGLESVETEDALYRLDAQLGSLMEFVDSHIGAGNTLYVVTSDHGAGDSYTEGQRMPGGKFNVVQFKVLINGFLNSRYGTANWVVDYANRSLYLNRRLAFEKGIDLAEMQASAAAFTMQFRGVARAVTATALQNNGFSGGELGSMQNGYYPKHSGDMVLSFMPGWSEESDSGELAGGGSMYEYDCHVPLLWYGCGLPKLNIGRPVDITDIAPTLSGILGINRPNASTGSEITDIISKFDAR